MFNSSEIKRIEKFGSDLTRNIRIRLTITKDERSGEFAGFCDRFARLAPDLQIEKEIKEIGEPEIRVSEGLRYKAIPHGTELDPFLEALEAIDGNRAPLPENIRQHLDKIRAPENLSLFISPHCAFCPAVVRRLYPLALYNNFFRLMIIDGFLFPEIAKEFQILSTPTVIYNENFRWTGDISVDEILEVIASRDPSNLSASALERMIKEGRASQLARMMMDKAEIFPAFYDVLTHTNLEVRLGAMAAMEEIADTDSELARTGIQLLWERLQQANDQVKGDILYILGETGDEEILPEINRILEETPNPEIKEAAAEAIDKIKGRLTGS